MSDEDLRGTGRRYLNAPHPILEWIHEHADRAIRPLRLIEKEAILQAMILCRGNQRLAAERLGISRETLLRKLRRYRRADEETLF